ncbi:nucleolar complex protein 4 homolog [Liolophura sinensis]|uniref:nucleolar complex protein 4 homolog n=1 Tax=Liolophura sinensis TaxID=3198878 RepID=UPI0031584267
MAGKTCASKSSVKEIKLWTQEFLNDRKKSNNLLNIVVTIEQSTTVEVQLAGVRALHKILQHLVKNGELYSEHPDQEGDSAADKYRSWLRCRYDECVQQLLGLLHNTSSSVQELALCTLMKLVKAEGEYPIQKLTTNQLPFPKHLLKEIYCRLTDDGHDMGHLITRFSEYLQFDDVRYFIFKMLLPEIQERQKKKGQENLLVQRVCDYGQLWAWDKLEDPLSNLYCSLPDPEAQIKLNSLKEHRKLFTGIWLEFLRNSLSTSLYKKVLVGLHEKVMPNLTSPLLLSDFLTQSYNIGGAISLLALNSLFILVHQYNLDYPDFFKKLYALFEPGIFHVKYKARFFHLADLFLTSSHLPAYLVAAFAKKLSRISLTAPPHGLKLSIPFVYNLLTRHPSCRPMLHRPGGPSDVTADPFDAAEPDPAKCKAMESSLWEIQTLQSHYFPDIALLAQKINSNLPTTETTLTDLLELSTRELFQRQAKKMAKDVPMNYNPPKGLLQYKDDKMALLWNL